MICVCLIVVFHTSFSLVTLQAAVEYVKTLSPENLRPLNARYKVKEEENLNTVRAC